MIKAYLLGEKIQSNTAEAYALYEKSSFGEKIRNIIEYSQIETLFLVQEERMQVYKNKKLLSFDYLLKKIKKFDRRIETKLIVFSDLRKKGYIIKSALKFGAEFRVYDKGTKPKKSHARWLLYTTKDSNPISWHDFTAKNRVAHSTKKSLLIAIVDEESDVSYYEVFWHRP